MVCLASCDFFLFIEVRKIGKWKRFEDLGKRTKLSAISVKCYHHVNIKVLPFERVTGWVVLRVRTVRFTWGLARFYKIWLHPPKRFLFFNICYRQWSEKINIWTICHLSTFFFEPGIEYTFFPFSDVGLRMSRRRGASLKDVSRTENEGGTSFVQQKFSITSVIPKSLKTRTEKNKIQISVGKCHRPRKLPPDLLNLLYTKASLSLDMETCTQAQTR